MFIPQVAKYHYFCTIPTTSMWNILSKIVESHSVSTMVRDYERTQHHSLNYLLSDAQICDLDTECPCNERSFYIHYTLKLRHFLPVVVRWQRLSVSCYKYTRISSGNYSVSASSRSLLRCWVSCHSLPFFRCLSIQSWPGTIDTNMNAPSQNIFSWNKNGL